METVHVCDVDARIVAAPSSGAVPLVVELAALTSGAVGGYSFESFRLAWTVQYAIWALATVGILITRKKTRKQVRVERNLLEGFEPHPPTPAATR